MWLVDEPLPSVRVEVESASADVVSPAIPDGPAPKGGRSSRGVIFGAVAAIGLVIAVLFLVRPDDGNTAAGTERQATTTTAAPTTTAPPTTTSAGSPEEDEAFARPRDPAVEVTDFDLGSDFFSFLSIVPFDRGYLMLDGGDSFDDRGGLELFRSLDGLAWREIDVEILEDSADDADVELYSLLVPTNDGVAVLRESVLRQGSFGGEVTQSRERLTSTDGATWTVSNSLDASADDLFGEFSFFALHTGDLAAYPAADLGERTNPLEELLRATLRPEIELPDSGVCFVDVFGATLNVWPCNADEPLEVTTDDFIDPELASAVRACAGALDVGPALPNTRVVHRFADDTTQLVESSAAMFGATALPDGTVVAAFDGNPEFAFSTGCEQFIDLPEVTDPVIELWRPDGSIELVPLPDGIEVSTSLTSGLPPSLAGAGDNEVFVAFESDVWHLDLMTREWTLRFGFENSEFGFGFSPVSFNDRQALFVNGEFLDVADLATGEITSIDLGSDESLILNADDTYAHVATFDFDGPVGARGEVLRVTLPAPGDE